MLRKNHPWWRKAMIEKFGSVPEPKRSLLARLRGLFNSQKARSAGQASSPELPELDPKRS
jgi:hypothetical protein